MKKKSVHLIVDLLFIIVGSLIFSFGMQIFAIPNQIAPGGVSGLAVSMNYLTGMSVGTWSFLINIPLLLLGFHFLGKVFTAKTLLSVGILSVSMDVMGLFTTPYDTDTLLASIFAGILIGAGLSLVFLRGSTTGGTDIISRLIQRRHPYVPMGKLLLLIDMVVILFSALVFRKLEVVLYSLVTVFICSHTIDSVLYGLERGKLLYIMSEQTAVIAEGIIKELDRGCTLLKGSGAYSGKDCEVLLVAVRRQQYYRVKEIVHAADPSAFIIISDSSEVLGEGFKPILHHS